MPPSKGLNSLVEAEHIGPNETGDNINAKRVANYVWDGVSAWQRMTQSGSSGTTNLVSTVNSTTATLTSGSVFTGTSEDVSGYADIRISTFSDVASATDGLSIQQSTNGTNWDITDTYTIPAGTGKAFSFGVSARYYRVVYTNGGTNQATFRLQSVFHISRTKPSSQRPQDARTNDNDMEEDLAYQMVYNGTTWDRVRSVGTGVPLSALSDGTNTTNVLKSDGTAAGQNSQMVSATYQSQAFSFTSVTAGTSFDVGNYKSFSVQITSLYTGTTPTVNFQGSNDNVNWVPVSGITVQQASGNGTVTSMTTTGIDYGQLSTRYFRLNMTGAYTSGTTAGIIIFSTLPPAPFSVQVNNPSTTVNTASATGAAVPANAFYQGGNTRTSSPTAATNGNSVGFTTDSMGEQLVAVGGLVTTSVPANASNVVVKGTPGRLCNILVTTTGVTAMLVYDNATTNSGTIIGQLPASAAVGSIYQFNMPAAAGITIAGSATNPAVTVSWI